MSSKQVTKDGTYEDSDKPPLEPILEHDEGSEDDTKPQKQVAHTASDVHQLKRPFMRQWVKNFQPPNKEKKKHPKSKLDKTPMGAYFRNKRQDNDILLHPHPEVVKCETT